MKPIILSSLLMLSLLPMQTVPIDRDKNPHPLATLLAKVYVTHQGLSAHEVYVETRRKITKTGTSFAFSILDNSSGHSLKHKLQELHGGSCIEVHEEFPLGVFLGPYITDGLVYCLMGPEVCPGTIARCETNGSLAAFEQMNALIKAELAKNTVKKR